MKQIQALWRRLPDGVKRTLHTAWQVALPTLVVHLLAAHSSKDIQASLIAAGSVFCATVKNAVVGQR